MGPDTAILTLLRGDDKLTRRWVSQLRRAEFSSPVMVYAVAQKTHLDTLPKLSGLNKIAGVQLVEAPQPPAELDVNGRTQYAVDLSNVGLKKVIEPHVFLLDDDMRIPLDGFGKLAKALRHHPKAAGICSTYFFTEKQKDFYAATLPTYPPIFLTPEFFEKATAKRPVFAVDLGGIFFSIWRKEALDAIAPFEFRHGGRQEYICRSVAEKGYRLFQHGGVICKHTEGK